MIERKAEPIYPNPSNNFLYVDAEFLNSSEINVLNMNGENVLSNIKLNPNSMDISRLPAGKYILKSKSKSLSFIKN